MSGWLITGGAGFIGSNFVRMAAERVEDELVVIDALTYAGNLANIVDLVDSSRVHFVRGDICDEGAVARIFQEFKIDRVVHFAAESSCGSFDFRAKHLLANQYRGDLYVVGDIAKNLDSK